MKKILFTSLFAACAAMGLSSCMNGDYDANPEATASGTNPLIPIGTGGGSGSGSASYYSWNGTDPLSAKIDGTAYTATVGTATDVSGSTLVQASGDGKSFTVTFPSTTANGTILTLSSTSTTTVGFTDGAELFSSATGEGNVYIMENDATHTKGKFFATVKVNIHV